jgi:hypothetical protein
MFQSNVPIIRYPSVTYMLKELNKEWSILPLWDSTMANTPWCDAAGLSEAFLPYIDFISVVGSIEAFSKNCDLLSRQDIQKLWSHYVAVPLLMKKLKL